MDGKRTDYGDIIAVFQILENGMAVPEKKPAVAAYLDRRAWQMLLLGFSSGLPLMLIFSTLSLWLVEAGVERKTVTMFSWAALAYSFKFVWSPLVDQLPVPFLSRRFGQRRGWMLLSQAVMVGATLWMAALDPSRSELLFLMAAAAVLLGFASATQDVAVDAYRIEAAPADAAMQSVLSSTYVAGYRIGMIVSGGGALLLAADFGTSVQHYDYSAWQKTYGLMAAAMGVGIATVLCLREPAVVREAAVAEKSGYIRLFAAFVAAAAVFVAAFRAAGDGLRQADSFTLFLAAEAVRVLAVLAVAAAVFRLFWRQTAAVGNAAVRLRAVLAAVAVFWVSNRMTGALTAADYDVWLSFLAEAVRLVAALAAAAAVTWAAVRLHWLPADSVYRTWVLPVRDFFRRYGRRALLLLALVGLYRVSDIVSGAISNVFYTDLGFSKTEIAEAVKTFGVLMVVVGGFVGGVLAQRVALMKMMMLGAAAAAATNLLFSALAVIGRDIGFLYFAVGLDNFAAGLAGTVFVAFLSALTNIRFTAVQYALFSSMMTLLPKTLGGYSGAMVDKMGYPNFFLFTALLGLPILLLVYLAQRYLDIDGRVREDGR